MRLLFMILFSAAPLLSSLKQDELRVIEATYDGHAEGVFYFVDIEGSSYVFGELEPKALKKFDFANRNYEGLKFTVIYRIVHTFSEGKENENDYGECIIVDLELVRKH